MSMLSMVVHGLHISLFASQSEVIFAEVSLASGSMEKQGLIPKTADLKQIAENCLIGYY